MYLLCSDGLSRMVPDEEIRATLLAVADLEVATKTLVDKANLGGGRDNITAIVVRVDHSTESGHHSASSSEMKRRDLVRPRDARSANDPGSRGGWRIARWVAIGSAWESAGPGEACGHARSSRARSWWPALVAAAS